MQHHADSTNVNYIISYSLHYATVGKQTVYVKSR